MMGTRGGGVAIYDNEDDDDNDDNDFNDDYDDYGPLTWSRYHATSWMTLGSPEH